MLFSSIDLLLNDPLTFLKVFPVILAAIGSALLLGITVHEASHALVAFRLGDYTAKRLGRLTLNPLRHLDPTGALMLVIVGFGWGKPVPVNPYYLAGGRKGLALVSAAGPISNLISASLLAIPFKLDLLTPSMRFSSFVSFDNGVAGIIAVFLTLVIFYNLVLAVFNLIPLFPLDGSKVLLGLLPNDAARQFARLEPYGPAILILLVATDIFTNIGIFSRILGPMVNYVGSIVLGHTFF